MNKKNLLSLVAAMVVVAMTFVGCGNKTSKNEVQEVPIDGVPCVKLVAADGGLGLKAGPDILIEPTTDYKSFTALAGFIVADFETDGYISTANKKLLDPDTGRDLINGDTIVAMDGYFEAVHQAGGETVFSLYIPATKKSFAATEYAVVKDRVITKFYGKITLFDSNRNELFSPTDDYKKVALLPDGSLLVWDGNIWGTGKITKDKLIEPGKALTARDLKKYQAMTGWNNNTSVMILQ